jgi:hypothetical protein
MLWTERALCQTPTLVRVVAVGFGPCHCPTPYASSGATHSGGNRSRSVVRARCRSAGRRDGPGLARPRRCGGQVRADRSEARDLT